MPSSFPCLSALTSTPGWILMQETLKEVKVPGATWQNLLAVHTSTCCQPKKAPAMVESLEVAGLGDLVTDLGTGKVCVKLRIPKLLPGLTFGLTSSWLDDHASAKEEVCFDTLTFLLCIAPHVVAIHPNR